MEVLIKEITTEQLEESAKIIRESFQTVAEEFGFTIESNPSNGAFIEVEQLRDAYQKGVAMFGVYEDKRQVGFVAAEKKDSSVYYLEKLAVLPCCRHRGYGKLLMNHVRDYVRAKGGQEISIAIIDENTKLKEWYQAYGFKETALKKFEHLSFTVCFLSLPVSY